MANQQLTLDSFDDLPEKPDTEQIAKISLANWRKHLKAVGLLESQITKLIDAAVKEAARLGKRISPADIGRAFSKNPTLRNALDTAMRQLADDLTATIEQGNKEAWLRSNTTGNAIILQMAAGNAALATLLQSQQTKPQNDRALLAFQKREVAGMNLSQRVWKLVEATQRDMERAVEVALAEGTPAAKLSQRVRQLLQEPNRLYRRVRDKDGNLRLSQAAQQYKPGRGVYRSSYKNAMRLARTEVNMAYHSADSERWKNSWWVRGIRIWLSNNHTVKDSKGHPQPLVDICDELKGDYPADFKFSGWHPQCRCVATALTCSYADIRDYCRRKQAGEDMTGYTPPGTIAEPPAAFKNWLADNSDRLAGAAERGTTPYFVRDNAKYTQPQATSQPNEKYTSKTYKSGGELQEPTIGSQNKQERAKNHRLAEDMAKNYGMKLRILPVDRNAPKGQSQPDCLNLENGNNVELKICNPQTDNAKSSIQNAIREANRQGCQQVIASFDRGISTISIYKGIKASLQEGRSNGIRELIIKFEDGRIGRYDLGVWRKRVENIRKKRDK